MNFWDHCYLARPEDITPKAFIWSIFNIIGTVQGRGCELASVLWQDRQFVKEPLRGHRLHLLHVTSHHLSYILFTWAEHTVLNVVINTSLAGAHVPNCAFLMQRTQADKTQVPIMTTKGVQHTFGHVTHTLTRTQACNARHGCVPRQMIKLPENGEHTKHFDIFNLCLKPTSFTTMMLSPTVVSLQGRIDWLRKSCPKTTTEVQQETRKAWKPNLLLVCQHWQSSKLQRPGQCILTALVGRGMNHWSKKWYKFILIGFVRFFVQFCLFVWCWLFWWGLNTWNQT